MPWILFFFLFSQRLSAAEPAYEAGRIGERHAWTLYQQPYDKANYGHVFEWSRAVLGQQSTFCLEIDAETHGEHFSRVMDDYNCPEMALDFLWTAPSSEGASRCVQVDKKTKGRSFIRAAQDGQCSKPPVLYEWARALASSSPVCFEVDASTEGRKYRHATDSLHCPQKLDVEAAYGKKEPILADVPVPKIQSRSPASIPVPTEVEKSELEELEDLIYHR